MSTQLASRVSITCRSSTRIYQSLFNRDADVTGLTFFSNALSAGTLNINNVAIAILDGAIGSDKTIVDTKIAAANLYTAALDTGPEIVAYSGTAAANVAAPSCLQSRRPSRRRLQ